MASHGVVGARGRGAAAAQRGFSPWVASGLGVLALCALCAARAHAAPVGPATTYSFLAAPHDHVVDHPGTPLSYLGAPGLRMSMTLAAPLAPGLVDAALAPLSWSYDDGRFAETSDAPERVFARVSTDGAGTLTGFLLQVFLDAPNTPGVWVRRDGAGDAYATTFAQSVVTGWIDPCAGWTVCDPLPVTEWAVDRAWGAGPVAVEVSAADPVSTFGAGPAGAPTATGLGPPLSTPLPAPLALLAGGLALLAALARRRRRRPPSQFVAPTI